MQQCNAGLQLRDHTSFQVITVAAPFFEGPVRESGADGLKRTYGLLSVCLILEVRLTCFEPLLAGYLLAIVFGTRMKRTQIHCARFDLLMFYSFFS